MQGENPGVGIPWVTLSKGEIPFVYFFDNDVFHFIIISERGRE